MNSLWLALLSSLAWGASDFGAGLKSRSLSVIVVTSGILAVGGVGAFVILTVEGAAVLATRTVPLATAAALLAVVGLTALYQALGEGRMSVVAPISATGVGLPIIFGLLGGDDIGWVQVVGILVAVAGMLVIVRTAAEDEKVGATSRRSIVLALLAAVGLGLFYLVAGSVAEGQSLWFSGIAQVLGAVILAGAATLIRGPLPSRRDARDIAGLGILGLVAWWLATAALSKGPLSLTSTITALYPVVTVGLALIVGGERVRRPQLVALIAVFAGIGAMAGG